MLVSVDKIYFYVHLHRLLGASSNEFDMRLPTEGISYSADDPFPIRVSEPADVVNVILHTMYEQSCRRYNPPFGTISKAVKGLKKYGVSLGDYIANGTPLYDLVLGQSPLRPTEAFAIAAEHGLEELATKISPLLLSMQINDLPDQLAAQMGGVYLKRVVRLQNLRRDFFHICIDPPYPHATTTTCSQEDRQALSRAWMLAVASLVLNSTPGKLYTFCLYNAAAARCLHVRSYARQHHTEYPWFSGTLPDLRAVQEISAETCQRTGGEVDPLRRTLHRV